MPSIMAPVDVSQSHILAHVRGELESLQTAIDRAARRIGNSMTRQHLRDVSERIDNIFENED
jgi:hypothetical protein